MKDLAPADESPKVFDLRALAGTERLDLFLAGQNLGLTRSQLRRLINDGHVLLNGQAAKGSHRVRLGDQVSLTVPPPRPTKVVPQWMPLTMVFEDDDLVVIDKPAGLSVHPAIQTTPWSTRCWPFAPEYRVSAVRSGRASSTGWIRTPQD